MAITPISRPSISSVLASNTVSSAPAPAAAVSIPTASSSGSSSATPATWSIASYIAQGMNLAQAQSARNDILNFQKAQTQWMIEAAKDPTSNNFWLWWAIVGTYNLPKVTTQPLQNQSNKTQPKVPSLNLSPKQNIQVWNVLSDFRNAISASKGDRASYNSSINYDGLSANRKKLADNYFNQDEKKRKSLTPTPYDENPLITDRQKQIDEENKKQQDLLDQQKQDMLDTEMRNKDITDNPIDVATTETTSERDKTIAEQEQMAQSAESNRLNQLRGNIMSRLAQRGVDISRLSPEQITALSGEEGSKAFMDVADIKDRKTKTIESVRQSALAKLNELRDKKSLNQTAYNSRVNEINSKTAAAKLQADKEFGANVFALSQTKEQQSRSDALARVNAAQQYLTAIGVSGPTATKVISSLSTKGLPDETIKAIASNPAVGEYLKQVEAASLAQKNIDNALKQGKLTIDQYKAETGRISANRPRSAGGWLGAAITALINQSAADAVEN